MASAEGVDVAVCVWAACRVRVAECEDNMLLCGGGRENERRGEREDALYHHRRHPIIISSADLGHGDDRIFSPQSQKSQIRSVAWHFCFSFRNSIHNSNSFIPPRVRTGLPPPLNFAKEN